MSASSSPQDEADMIIDQTTKTFSKGRHQGHSHVSFVLCPVINTYAVMPHGMVAKKQLSYSLMQEQNPTSEIIWDMLHCSVTNKMAAQIVSIA